MFINRFPSQFDVQLQPQPLNPLYAVPPVSDYLDSSFGYDSCRSSAALEQALIAQERQRLLAVEQQRRLLQARIRRAIQEEEDAFEHEWRVRQRQEMLAREREAETVRARERELARILRMQDQENLEAYRAPVDKGPIRNSTAYPIHVLFDRLLSPHGQHQNRPRAQSPVAATFSSLPSPFEVPAVSRCANNLDAVHFEQTHSTGSATVDSPARREALATLSTLATSFADRQSLFVDPTSFTFQPASTSDATPQLAFGSANAAFLSYEDFLVVLLSQIDAVESGGDRDVKHRRKELVKEVEKELVRLDAMKDRAWEEQVRGHAADTNEEDHLMREGAPESTARVPEIATSNQSNTSLPFPPPLVTDGPTDSLPVPPRPDSSILPTPHLDEDDEDAPLPPLLPSLTHEAVSCLPAATRPARSPSHSRSDSDSSSATSSTLTVSSGSSQVDEYISEMLRRAAKLGGAELVDPSSKPAVDETTCRTPLMSVLP